MIIPETVVCLNSCHFDATPRRMTQRIMMLSQERSQMGAPETVGTVSQSFLVQLAAKLGLRTNTSSPIAEIKSRGESGTIITETDDYDCRIGEKGRKRRREAQKVKKASGQTTGKEFVLVSEVTKKGGAPHCWKQKVANQTIKAKLGLSRCRKPSKGTSLHLCMIPA